MAYCVLKVKAKTGIFITRRKKEEKFMNIQGLQKLTLLDYPGKVACTLFTGGCNFRCPYCHNAGLVIQSSQAAVISEEEVLAFLKKRQGLLDGVCISGGEPLLHHDIGDFIQKVKSLGYLVKLDTNGSMPDFLRGLVEEKSVDYVAMDIKNSRQKYGYTIGVPEYDTSLIEQSVEYLKKSSIPYEFRTTVVREFHQREDFIHIGKWLSGDSPYYLQGFVDSGDLIQSGLHGYDAIRMQQALEIVKEYLPRAQLRGID